MGVRVKVGFKDSVGVQRAGRGGGSRTRTEEPPPPPRVHVHPPPLPPLRHGAVVS